MNQILIYFSLILLFFSSCTSVDRTDKDFDRAPDKSIIQEMESELQLLEGEIILLKDHFEFLLGNRDSILLSAHKDKYNFDEGFSTNTPRDSGILSSVVIFRNTPDYDRSLENVLVTNPMDSLFHRVINKYDMIAQVYFNTVDQVSRVYPPYDAKALLDPSIDVTKFNFFYEANEENNPGKGPKWTKEVYIDPAGRGWILSLIHPVFDGDVLYSVLGIDITIDTIITRYLEKRAGNYLIVNSKGDIVGGDAAAIEALSFPPLLNHVYRETIRADNFRISDFNLFNSKNKEVRSMAQAFLLQRKSHFVFKDDFSPKDAYAAPLNLLDWYLIRINPRGR
ncbi:cysteine protease [Algoriphagus sp. AGSA1]|uniref:cysteine protease n=1 Tax=Algoriphagus sp. AGSA1 TaxID=2907213 RepID=UPI001F41ED39|nr:cysteine protease [Algoriphagus sp. AGSA1]MCE7055522.1 cysteine protease [Algoriphagus sp. AGSA1]